MATALKSAERAEAACLGYLGVILNMNTGDNNALRLDDWIEPDVVNQGVFSISGGPEQTQVFGAIPPGGAWYGFGQFVAQYESRPDAVAARGKIMNAVPARREAGGPGIVPNVRNFEVLEHPEIFSQILMNEANEIDGRIFVLRVRFRVVYDNTAE